jgi:adenylate cyclase
MGSLGWYLINQQTQSIRQQSELLGQIVADQLSRAAGEPLLADDDLTLQVLVSQQEKNPFILGMEIYDTQGKLKARAGIPTAADIEIIILAPSDKPPVNWEKNPFGSVSFYSPILFKDVNAGVAIVSIDRRPFEKHLKTLTRALLTTTIGLILVGVLLAIPLAFRLAKPINQLVAVGEALDNSLLLQPNGMPERRKDAIGRIMTSFHRLGDQLEQNKQAEATFSRHLSPSIAREVLNTPQGTSLGGTTTQGSVLFCDIVSFTELSEDMSPADVGELLNRYFRYFSLAAHSCEGTVDKFIGDCIMIVFGVPEHDKLHGLHALTCAVLIQEIAARINQKRRQQDSAIVEFRLGINSGQMLAGNLGGEERMQYTVVGDTVNVASRICGLCEPGKVLATQAVFDQPRVSTIIDCDPMEARTVRGRKKPVIPYSIGLNNFVDDIRIRQELEQIFPQVES